MGIISNTPKNVTVLPVKSLVRKMVTMPSKRTGSVQVKLHALCASSLNGDV